MRAAIFSIPSPITILSGPIRSGKTTRLMEALPLLSGAQGVLSPDRGGLRWLFDIATAKWIAFEAESSAEEQVIQTVGRFRLLEEGFQEARESVRLALHTQAQWTVIDEVGKLELRGQGMEPMISEAVVATQSGIYRGNLLLVVRDSLLHEVIGHWEISQWRCF